MSLIIFTLIYVQDGIDKFKLWSNQYRKWRAAKNTAKESVAKAADLTKKVAELEQKAEDIAKAAGAEGAEDLMHTIEAGAGCLKAHAEVKPEVWQMPDAECPYKDATAAKEDAEYWKKRSHDASARTRADPDAKAKVAASIATARGDTAATKKAVSEATARGYMADNQQAQGSTKTA